MTIKENLIFALETAENENKTVEIGYVANEGISFTAIITPEVMTYDNGVEIYDSKKGAACHFSIEFVGEMTYSNEEVEVEEVYEIKTENGVISIYL